MDRRRRRQACAAGGGGRAGSALAQRLRSRPGLGQRRHRLPGSVVRGRGALRLSQSVQLLGGAASRGRLGVLGHGEQPQSAAEPTWQSSRRHWRRASGISPQWKRHPATWRGVPSPRSDPARSRVTASASAPSWTTTRTAGGARAGRRTGRRSSLPRPRAVPGRPLMAPAPGPTAPGRPGRSRGVSSNRTTSTVRAFSFLNKSGLAHLHRA